MRQFVIMAIMAMLFLIGCSNDQEAKSLSFLKGSDKATATQEGEGEILAKVGDDVILEKDIDMLLSKIPQQYRMRYSSADAKKEIVQRLVDVKMLAWEAKRRGIDKRADVKTRIEYLIDQMLAKELEEEVSNNIEVTDKEVAKYYDEHKDKFSTPPKIKVRHILVKTKEEAEEVLKEIKGGKDFAALAKERSNCPSAKKGGDLGWISRGRMDPAFEKAAFALGTGDISDVVKTSYGYHIIKAEDKRPAKVKDLDKVKAAIEKTLVNDKLKGSVEDLSSDIKSKVNIEINEDYFASAKAREEKDKRDKKEETKETK
ncbi:MAG: peptidylprolyl isomerase [Thermodesulfobacteriota bacterium]|nr:peptidylprolyl isomerase [Thermodesulfobacteriota bacterium]